MSDNIVTLSNQKREEGDTRNREPNARRKWIADVVCAMLDAESIKRPSSALKDPHEIK
jgi:hypothetical protein